MFVGGVRVSQMCQKFESSLSAVRFPLLDLSCLYKDQNILIFRGWTMDICVLKHSVATSSYIATSGFSYMSLYRALKIHLQLWGVAYKK